MKMHLSFCLLLALSTQASFAAEPEFRLSPQDKLQAAHDLETSKDKPENSEQTKRMMSKVAESLRISAFEDQSKIQDSECAVNGNESEPLKEKKPFFTRLGRTLGKGATWLSVQTMKPFMTAGSFMTGFFEKEEKNQDVVGLYNIFLKNAPEFDDLYKEAGTPEEFLELLMLKFEQIVEKKTSIIMHDTLVALNLGVDIPENLEDLDWSKVDISKLDSDKIDPKLINEHPEYQDLRAILGDFTKEQIEDILASGYYDPAVDFENVKAAMPKVHELAGALVGQIFGPKIVLGVISGSLASLYTTPVLLADVGAGVSVAVCLNKNTQEKLKSDDDLRQFCSYATNWSSYELMKSRAKGYVSGKKTKAKLKKWNKKRKEKRAEKRRQRELASVSK
ncbi:MAG: hypothetical protein K2P81_13440 [Bacteriovoracaceae bacterium]|nr:hypothetical protein [Bacteriovoracaceae bacterium]